MRRRKKLVQPVELKPSIYLEEIMERVGSDILAKKTSFKTYSATEIDTYLDKLR